MKKQQIILLFLLMQYFGGLAQIVDHKHISYDPESKKLEFFTAINSEKAKVRIEFKNSKFLLVDFSTPGCKGCVKGIPKVIEFSKKYKDKLDVVMLDSYANYKIWMFIYEQLHTADLPLQLLSDEKGTVAKAFDIKLFPTYLLFDEKGVLIQKWKGKLPRKLDKYLTKQ